MTKRLNGGSSPRKEDAYKSHFPITEMHKRNRMERIKRQLNKRHPGNKYDIVDEEKHGRTCHVIKLIKGKKHKKTHKSHRSVA